ncbi:hypothetical protein GCM10023196_098640 [Actinoallomurus vinaceus]|uniref:Uncharacterized protein n=1 Tax=Actinoallomurus vinaceus TaxID=1080074 RepID=A0ABP8USC2_9ACTN
MVGMAGRGRSRWREIGFAGGALGLGVALGAIVVALGGWDLSTAANVAQLVSVVVPAPALLAGLVVWRRRSAGSTTAPEVRGGVQVYHGLRPRTWCTSFR